MFRGDGAGIARHRRRRLILDRNGKLLYEVLDPDAGKQLDLTLSHMPRACVQATSRRRTAAFSTILASTRWRSQAQYGKTCAAAASHPAPAR